MECWESMGSFATNFLVGLGAIYFLKLKQSQSKWKSVTFPKEAGFLQPTCIAIGAQESWVSKLGKKAGNMFVRNVITKDYHEK